MTGRREGLNAVAGVAGDHAVADNEVGPVASAKAAVHSEPDDISRGTRSSTTLILLVPLPVAAMAIPPVPAKLPLLNTMVSEMKTWVLPPEFKTTPVASPPWKFLTTQF